MSNTITAYFKGRTGVAESVYQNDYGIVMVFDEIDLPAHFDCYFSVPGSDTATAAVGADNRVVIPNSVLGNSGNMSVHIPLHTGTNDSEVEYVAYFKVIGRARPEDDGTPAQMTAIEQALALLQNPITNIEQIVNEALSFTGETFDEMQEDLAEWKTDTEEGLETWKSGVESDFDNLEAQFDTAVAAVTTDTEVTNIRVGDDNVTYTTAGQAVRTQFSDIKDTLRMPSITDANYVQGARLADGSIASDRTTKCTLARTYYLKAGDTIETKNLDSGLKIVIAGISNGSVVYDSGWKSSNASHTVTTDEGAYFINVSKTDESTLAPSAISTLTVVIKDGSTRLNKLEKRTDNLEMVSSNYVCGKNLIGNEPSKLYFAYIPTGTNFVISMANGQAAPEKIIIDLYGKNKDYLGYWTMSQGSTSRTIEMDVDTYWIAKRNSEDVVIQLEYGTAATAYEPHFDNLRDINNYIANSISGKYEIPSYLDTEYSETLSSINTNLEEDTVNIGIMTDLHFPSLNSGYNSWLRNGVFYSMQALSNMTKDINFDFVSFLGDYEQFPSIENGQVKQMGFDNLLEINEYLQKMNCKALAIEGNHELNYAGGGTSYGMTDDEFYRYCTEQLVYRNGIITDGIHCYYDDVAHQLRYIFINTTTEVVDASITAFLTRASDTDYDVVVLSHYGGNSGTLYASTKSYIDTLRTNGANVILWLSGHTHQDWHYEYNGCLIISFLQSGYWTSEESENGVTYEHETGNKNYCAFTAVLLNRTEGKVHCIRFGLGIDYTYDLVN